MNRASNFSREDLRAMEAACSTKDLRDIVTTRQASKALFEKLQWVEQIHVQLTNAMAFDSASPEQQSVHRDHALFDDANELKARVAALEAAVAALNAQFNKSKRKRQ